MGPPGSPRLRALAEHSDGFRLAEIDLELRSEGELVGTRQSGMRQFKVAQLPEDAALLERARALRRGARRSGPRAARARERAARRRARRGFGAEALDPIPA